jgi:hypothetical protein
MPRLDFRRLLPALTTGLVLATSLPAQTTLGRTVLTFDMTGTSGILPQNYGDNVTGPAQGTYSYGGVPTYTPDITVQYFAGSVSSQFNLFASGYGDLVNVIYGPAGGANVTVTLSAQSGAAVQLFGFDVGSWGNVPRTVPTINVRDGAGTLLFSDVNALVPSGHLHEGFSPPLAGLTLVIEFVCDASGFYFLALDNVEFGEFAPGGLGQADSPQAGLRVNGVGSAGLHGPFAETIPLGGTLSLDWNGPPGSPLILAGGPSHPASISIPCVGTLDIGTPPLFPDILIFFDGTQTGFPDFLFRLNTSGTAHQSFSVAQPATVSLQGAVVQPAGSACTLMLTAAFNITIM